MECIKCKTANSEPHITCDSCERAVHTQCSGLNATELKVMSLRGKRGLRFYCEECELGVKLVPKLIKKLDELQTEVEQLKAQMLSFSPQDNTTQIPLIPDTHSEQLANEVIERQKRTNNIVIFNLPENSESDLSKVQEVFNTLVNRNFAIQSILRVGKKNRNGHRALKVTLNNGDEARKIITSDKKPLSEKQIYVSADLTPAQISHLKAMRQEVESRKENGENVTIKYVKGVPQIKEIPAKNSEAAPLHPPTTR